MRPRWNCFGLYVTNLICSVIREKDLDTGKFKYRKKYTFIKYFKNIHLSKYNLSELIKPRPFYPNNTRTSAPYRNLHVFTGVLIIDDIRLSKTEWIFFIGQYSEEKDRHIPD